METSPLSYHPEWPPALIVMSIDQAQSWSDILLIQEDHILPPQTSEK